MQPNPESIQSRLEQEDRGSPGGENSGKRTSHIRQYNVKLKKLKKTSPKSNTILVTLFLQKCHPSTHLTMTNNINAAHYSEDTFRVNPKYYMGQIKQTHRMSPGHRPQPSADRTVKMVVLSQKFSKVSFYLRSLQPLPCLIQKVRQGRKSINNMAMGSEKVYKCQHIKKINLQLIDHGRQKSGER